LTRSRDTKANQIAIAKAAGVSVSTVSRALADGRGISEERRQQIIKLAEDAGYLKRGRQPAQAQHLRVYVTGSLATGGLAPFYEAVVAGLQENAEEYGFTLSVRMVDESTLSPERMARDQTADEARAVLFVGIDLSADLSEYFLSRGGTAILVNGYDPMMRFDCVAPNNFYGAMSAGRALLEAGHRKLLYIHDHTRWTTTQRRRGFHAALEDFPDAALTTISVAGGADGELLTEVEKRAAGQSDWTGVFAANDMGAFRLITALDTAGLSVPGDVSVIGFDDLPYAALMHPRLSTMRVDCFEMARQAIGLVQRRVAYQDAQPIQVECAVHEQPGGTVSQIA
jgi:DNA-binding LacI/PurR family transcriptional regulator